MNKTDEVTKQYLITPAAGKRLIAKSMLSIPSIQEALKKRTIVIIAGTTNGYVAEELLNSIDQADEFSRERFFRGVNLPPGYTLSEMGRLDDESKFPGDVVIEKGKLIKGKTIFDLADNVEKGDIIIKGANAVNIEDEQAALYIGHPAAGTILPTYQTVFGKRVELYLPAGLEKRITGNINKIAGKLNSQQASGPRYMPINGNIITELQAINLISGAKAEIVAGGGICGAEGCYWIAVSGSPEQIQIADKVIDSIKYEENFKL
ncbi:MAG: hypothetical protein ACOC3B_03265 [Bacillota bacterium]